MARSLDNAPDFQMIKEENRRLLMDLGAAEHMLKQTQAKLFHYDEQMQYETYSKRQEQPMYQVTSESKPSDFLKRSFPFHMAHTGRGTDTPYSLPKHPCTCRYPKTRTPDPLDPSSHSLGVLPPRW